MAAHSLCTNHGRVCKKHRHDAGAAPRADGHFLASGKRDELQPDWERHHRGARQAVVVTQKEETGALCACDGATEAVSPLP
eukprot:950955-Pyramimonas_sp.AAC.1